MRCFNAPDSRYKWSLSGYLWSVDCTDTQLSLISGDDGAIFFSLYGARSSRSLANIRTLGTKVGILTQASPRRVPRPRNDALLSISLVKRRGPLAFRPSPGFCHRSNHNCSLVSSAFRPGQLYLTTIVVIVHIHGRGIRLVHRQQYVKCDASPVSNLLRGPAIQTLFITDGLASSTRHGFGRVNCGGLCGLAHAVITSLTMCGLLRCRVRPPGPPLSMP
ncbi:hypothetical protein BDP67DRAFT_523706 [Colletotrichum lupini]|nr:hypothetical protein BDP67DRAFT_523706 [Colletotrichum lupini]